MSERNISGVRIREAREKRGLEQIDLSVALEDYNIRLSQSGISEIENGIRSVRDWQLPALAEILKVTPNWLVNWKSK